MCDYPEFVNVTTPKARKKYRCHECGQAIEAGVQYVSISGKWDGEVSTFKSCTECAAVVELLNGSEYSAIHPDDCGLPYGMLRECLLSYPKETISLVPLEKLSPYWRAKLEETVGSDEEDAA